MNVDFWPRPWPGLGQQTVGGCLHTKDGGLGVSEVGDEVPAVCPATVLTSHHNRDLTQVCFLGELGEDTAVPLIVQPGRAGGGNEHLLPPVLRQPADGAALRAPGHLGGGCLLSYVYISISLYKPLSFILLIL